MNEIMKKIRTCGIVPVVAIEDAKDAKKLGEALLLGGLPCAEITFRTTAAGEAIRRMKEKFPELLLGAGTVLTVDQVNEALSAGAEFIVSPGFDPEIVDYVLDRKVPILPGCVTPSEVNMAVKRNLKVVKFFPAELAGGLSMIRAMAAPYTDITFMPTGGINGDNVRNYLQDPCIFACGGSWMVKKEDIAAGNFEKIRTLTAEAASIVKEIRGM